MYIGIDIGGTKCAVLLSDSQGKILKKRRFNTTSCQETLKQIIDTVLDYGQAESIGISCGGPLDAQNGIILSPPNLPDWDRVPITDVLMKETGIPAYLQNDANACALAEWKLGAGIGCNSMIFLTFGTGMGAGLILNGRLYAGCNGNAGEIGHVRMAYSGPVGFGKSGSFEGFCSGGGLRQMGVMKATELFQTGKAASFCKTPEQLDQITAQVIANCANSGYADAIEVFDSCGTILGQGLAMLVDILNPQRIIIGSIYGRCTSLLSGNMYKVLHQECLPQALEACKILPSGLGEEIGDYAAICVAISGKEGTLQ